MIKLIILDFDDTLCLTEEACFHMENDVIHDMGYPPMGRATHKKNWGKLLEIAITERVPGIEAKDFMSRIGAYVTRYTSEGKLDAISDENLKTLETLRDQGKKIAILTSRTFPEVRHLMHESHPLASAIEKIYHKDNSSYLKPDPRVFEQVLADFMVSPQEAVYIGDAVSDAAAAKGAGLHFVAVLESGLRKRSDFRDYRVDFFAKKFTEILEYTNLHASDI